MQGIRGGTIVKLDVVVPTYQRSHLLRRTITSLIKAVVPCDLEVIIIIVDNYGKDDTAEVVQEIRANTSRPIVYLVEPKRGLSNARNAGIRAGSGDIIGFIDDDEEIQHDWFEVVAREFADRSTLFIGGPYLAREDLRLPDWLPPGYHAVIGVIPPKPRSFFDNSFNGILMGGNAVIRREVFERVGLYSTKLGRSGKGLLSHEDGEFYQRLRRNELKGVYVPDLVIYHAVPSSRLTRKYHRRWCFWRGASLGVVDRDAKRPLPYVLGVPRSLIGQALCGLASVPGRLILTRERARAFAGELALWDLLGFIYGRWFLRVDNYYGKE